MANNSILTRHDHTGGRRGAKFRRDKFINLVFDQLAIYNPRLLNQDVAAGADLVWFEKDVPGRTPVAFVAGKLPVTIMRSRFLVFPGFRLRDDWKRWAIFTKGAENIILRGIFAHTNNLKALALVLLV